MTCVWEPDPACLSDEWAQLTDDERHQALMLATSSLQMLTYNRVGTCPITIRPCPVPRSCSCAWNPRVSMDGGWTGADDDFLYASLPAKDRGVVGWFNDCAHRGACSPLSEIDLEGPVGYIESLVIDGHDQDLWGGDWRLDDGHLLVWQGTGPSPVPSTQDLNKADTEVGTWSITYSKSYPVLADGRLAVAYLAMEFANACKPRGKCKLPRGVTSVVRNGVSFNIEAGLFPNGLTGIEIVDAYILKWAPEGSPTRNATVFDPSRAGRSARFRRTSGVPARGPLGSV